MLLPLLMVLALWMCDGQRVEEGTVPLDALVLWKEKVGDDLGMVELRCRPRRCDLLLVGMDDLLRVVICPLLLFCLPSAVLGVVEAHRGILPERRGDNIFWHYHVDGLSSNSTHPVCVSYPPFEHLPLFFSNRLSPPLLRLSFNIHSLLLFYDPLALFFIPSQNHSTIFFFSSFSIDLPQLDAETPLHKMYTPSHYVSRFFPFFSLSSSKLFSQ